MRSLYWICTVILLLLFSWRGEQQVSLSFDGYSFYAGVACSSNSFNPEKSVGCSDGRTGLQKRGSCEEDSLFRLVTLQGPSSMGMIWMIDSLNRASSPSVKSEIVTEPIQVRKSMIDGCADFAVLPLTMAVILHNKGVDYRLLAIPVWGTLYLAGCDNNFETVNSDSIDNSWEYLRNKRIYTMARGMTPDVLFRYLLQCNGLDPDRDVILDYSFPTHLDLANAVAAGRARLAVLSEPQLSLAMHRNRLVKPMIDLNMSWHEQLGVEIVQTAFLVKGEVADKNPELVSQMVSAYAASTQRVLQSPGSSSVLITRYGILPDAAIARQSITRSKLNYVAADTIREIINDYLQIFYEMNPEIIGGALPDEDFFY